MKVVHPSSFLAHIRSRGQAYRVLQRVYEDSWEERGRAAKRAESQPAVPGDRLRTNRGAEPCGGKPES